MDLVIEDLGYAAGLPTISDRCCFHLDDPFNAGACLDMTIVSVILLIFIFRQRLSSVRA